MAQHHIRPADDDECPPWEQQPGEPDRDFARFTTWLTLADRRFHRAAPALGVTLHHGQRLSRTWNWQARAAAYDVDRARTLEADTFRARTGAACALALAVWQAAEALLEVPPADRQPRVLQQLASALRSLTPNTPALVLQAPMPPQMDAADLWRLVQERQAQMEAEGLA